MLAPRQANGALSAAYNAWMSIKSDKWIRRMAQEHGMIEPFEPGQVRQNAAGQRIVSYGTSSYGYDIRCAPEFKVFTNIYSTVVDPKNFDEKSFVDINADVCVIPPNSSKPGRASRPPTPNTISGMPTKCVAMLRRSRW